jgi:hypothetical protein
MPLASRQGGLRPAPFLKQGHGEKQAGNPCFEGFIVNSFNPPRREFSYYF